MKKTVIQVQKMIETGILILTKQQVFWHYSIVPFLLVAPLMTTFYLFQHLTNTYTGVRPIEDLAFAYIFVLPAVAFYFIQKRRLKFKVINVSVDKDTFKEAVYQTSQELKWTIEKTTTLAIVAKSGFNWKSWGERITIIWCSDKILFNSICDPDRIPSVASYGMNKMNRETFEQFLKQNNKTHKINSQ